MKLTSLISVSLLALLLLCGAGCKSKQSLQPEPETELSVVNEEAETATPEEDEIEKVLCVEYERTSCFGTCPVFKLRIYSNGYCTYEGINFVDLMGFYEGQMPEDICEQIREKALEIDYFGMEERYDAHVSDLPAVITQIADSDGALKRVNNRYNGPKELKELYAFIDQSMEGISWTRIQ